MLIGGGSPRDDYEQVQIRVFASESPDGAYTVELSAPGGMTTGRLPWPLDRAGLETAVDPKKYGRLLGSSLFAEEVLGPKYGEVLAAIRSANHGLRVQLRIDPPELSAIRWERMLQPIGGKWLPISVAAATPFSRYLSPNQWDRPLPVVDRPIRILAVVASPSNLSEFRLDPIAPAEMAALHQALEGQSEEYEVTYLQSGTADPPTLVRMRAALPTGFHAVHILCHGAVTSKGSVLYLEGDGGKVDPVATDRLVEAFGALAKPPLLCFLAACESAARGRNDSFVPLGPALVQDGGLQAVVAMSDRVGLKTAQLFSEQFYRRLLAHGQVDLAVNEARALVTDEWDWGVPVLFTRLQDNQLIDFPVGHIYVDYLAHADDAFAAAHQAMDVAQRLETGGPLLDALRELIQELSKSHKVVVDLASDFRDVSTDPEQFPRAFDEFFRGFKRRYDAEDWVDEKTSAQRIQMLAAGVLPQISTLLPADTFRKLNDELQRLGSSDGDLVKFLGQYLDSMNEATEAIERLLTSGDVADAIQAKRDFEAQITPTFRRSKEMLARMTDSLGYVSAA